LFLKKKHWRISFWLIFIMLFQLIILIGQIAFAGGPVYIGTLREHEFGGKGTEEEPYESRLWPDATHEDYGHRGTAQFKIKLSDGREILSPRESRESVGVGVITKTATDWSGAEYTAELGTGIQFENLSTGSPLGGSGGIHFQWYAPGGRRGIFSLNITQQGPMNSPEFPTVLDAVGEWRFYMYHYSSKEYTSANGNHFAAGRAVPNPDSEWYNTYFKQYFTAVKITVMPQNPPDPPDSPSGNIIFNPYQSADIPGNRDNWVNQNIPVKVTVEPSKERVVMTSSESRRYKYYDSCYSIDPETGDCEGKWVSSSTSCSFRQTWVATKLYVTGQGKTAQGSTVSIGPFIIPNGGTIANKGIGIRGKVMNILLHIYFKF